MTSKIVVDITKEKRASFKQGEIYRKSPNSLPAMLYSFWYKSCVTEQCIATSIAFLVFYDKAFRLLTHENSNYDLVSDYMEQILFPVNAFMSHLCRSTQNFNTFKSLIEICLDFNDWSKKIIVRSICTFPYKLNL